MKTLHLAVTLERSGFALEVQTELPLSGITAIYGASGCGKTSLLRCVAGLEPDAKGHVSVVQGDAREVWQDSKQHIFVPTYQRPVGFVFQEASLFEHLNVQGNLDYALKRCSLPRAHLDQTIELLGISHLLSRRPASLSGGERQRVAIARALATQPALLLLDEPLAALDASRRQEIMPWLEKIRDEWQMPMLYVTHAIDEVARLSDTLLLLSKGQLSAVGATSTLIYSRGLISDQGEGAAVLLDATVAALDSTWHLALVQAPGVDLWLRDSGLRVGQRVRIRLDANDVSVTLQPATATSIQNHVAVQVVSLQPDAHPSQVMVQLKAKESLFLARITARSVFELALTPGMMVWAQVKSVALIK